MRVERIHLETWEFVYKTMDAMSQMNKAEIVRVTVTPTELAAIKRTSKYKRQLVTKKKIMEVDTTIRTFIDNVSILK